MNVECPHCFARFFPEEGSSFYSCCARGAIKLQPFREPPEPLRTLLFGPENVNDTIAIRRRHHFHRNIRRINSIFSFGAFRANTDTRTPYNPFAFIIQGQPYTCNQPLEFQGHGTPGPNGQPAVPVHAQIYFYDPDQRLQYREALNQDIDSTVLADIDNTLHSVNSLLPTLHRAFDFLQLNREANSTATISPFLRLNLDTPDGNQRYSLPVAREVAALIPRDCPEARNSLDVCLRLRDGEQTRTIPAHNRLHWLLVYPLLFPFGDRAWGRDMQISRVPDQRDVHENVAFNVVNDDAPDDLADQGGDNEDQEANIADVVRRLTERSFWRYHFQVRQRVYDLERHISHSWRNPLLGAGALFQQLVVHVYSSILINVLNWYRYNNDKFRHDDASGAADAMAELVLEPRNQERN